MNSTLSRPFLWFSCDLLPFLIFNLISMGLNTIEATIQFKHANDHTNCVVVYFSNLSSKTHDT